MSHHGFPPESRRKASMTVGWLTLARVGAMCLVLACLVDAQVLTAVQEGRASLAALVRDASAISWGTTVKRGPDVPKVFAAFYTYPLSRPKEPTRGSRGDGLVHHAIPATLPTSQDDRLLVFLTNAYGTPTPVYGANSFFRLEGCAGHDITATCYATRQFENDGLWKEGTIWADLIDQDDPPTPAQAAAERESFQMFLERFNPANVFGGLKLDGFDRGQVLQTLERAPRARIPVHAILAIAAYQEHKNAKSR